MDIIIQLVLPMFALVSRYYLQMKRKDETLYWIVQKYLSDRNIIFRT